MMLKKRDLVVFWLLGCWATGLGLRMIYEHYYAPPDWYYFPITWDVFFDWTPLVLFGLYSLYFSMSRIHRLISGVDVLVGGVPHKIAVKRFSHEGRLKKFEEKYVVARERPSIIEMVFMVTTTMILFALLMWVVIW